MLQNLGYGGAEFHPQPCKANKSYPGSEKKSRKDKTPEGTYLLLDFCQGFNSDAQEIDWLHL